MVAPHGGGGGPVSAVPRSTTSPSTGPFGDDIDSVVVAFDPQMGFVAIGPFSPLGEPPRLRAWDLTQRRVLWEALQGQTWVDSLSRASVKVIGRNVYVAHKRQLMAFDLATGNRKWGSPLSDAIDGDDDEPSGLAVVDPFAPLGRGAVLVRTIDNGLFAFDRDSGQPLWQKSYGDKSFELTAVEGLGACLVRYGAPFVKIDVVNPAHPQPIASLGHDDWSTDLGMCRLHGRTVVTAVDDFGSEGDTDGLFAFDAVTGAVHFFEAIQDLDQDDIVPCSMGPRIFAAMDDGEGIYVGPRGRPIPVPVPNHVVAAFCSAGPSLAILLKKAHGTPVRRIIGIDPATLAFRFDAGEAGTEPDGSWDRQLATDGWSLVFVATPDDDLDRCELRSIDTTTGRLRWSRPIGRWRAHAFVGGHLVAWADGRIEVLAPANGQVVAALS
ncbi:MAG: uncharacterized protein JWP87_5769 [Labilithrix sp.]|nr:uncharacterized protein [Labilithrix sp.]